MYHSLAVHHLGLPAVAAQDTQQAPDLQGSTGSNPATPLLCQISALHDYEAVLCWLHEYRFLANPQPAERWCAPRGGKQIRGSSGWRPFVGPLSPAAQTTAITIIHPLFHYLVYAGYLDFNPIGLMRYRVERKQQDLEAQRLKVWARILEIEEWEAMLTTLYELPEATISERNEKEGKILVNDVLLEAVTRYRLYCGFSALPEAEDTRPLIQFWRTGLTITARYMTQLLKTLALKTAEKFFEYPAKMKNLRQFSPQWLRHLSATLQDRAGIAFKHIQANHRHASESTTRKYVHAFDKERHADMQKLSLPLGCVG
jgi:hypothetical protein